MEQVDVCLLQIIGNPLCKKRIFLLSFLSTNTNDFFAANHLRKGLINDKEHSFVNGGSGKVKTRQ
jgi:hypothetical protein